MGGDCDDSDPTVSPAAEEIRDAVDNDCNGEIDDGVLNLYFSDADEDGYGDPLSPIESCSIAVGMTTDNTDCNDSDAQVSPSGIEVCDGIDNNCDGLSDEDTAQGTQIYYADYDGDGFGDVNAPQPSCAQPIGFTTDDTDCDDNNDTISPNGTEICDFLDNDCDGQTDESTPFGFNTFFVDAYGHGQGNPNQTTEACFKPAGHVDNGGDCDDNDATSTVIAQMPIATAPSPMRIVTITTLHRPSWLKMEIATVASHRRTAMIPIPHRPTSR